MSGLGASESMRKALDATPWPVGAMGLDAILSEAGCCLDSAEAPTRKGGACPTPKDLVAGRRKISPENRDGRISLAGWPTGGTQ